jgi:hypothetical protein
LTIEAARVLAQEVIAGRLAGLTSLVDGLLATCEARNGEPIAEQSVLAGTRHVARIYAAKSA